ncbi:hypothetical protein BJ875DRAFT_522221 [Amylocarpus encephaloides]|uniref:Zn(2)-C6 fungal-type domain-containing protein n=1 Tax=Amylocarpus encephaloides TaxID=45428 RepID=A0A9P7YAZ3_9HELO|nr:hypothetical protein BJ875DRAFT_522221 [Amylocarpus encephaloides]
MDLFNDFMTPPPTGHLGEEEPSKRNPMEKRTGKLRRSCELCRNTKGRCCPSKDGNHCQRCAKEGKECVFLEAKPRPKRAKNSRIRVAEMEKKLDGLVALLASGCQVPTARISTNSTTTTDDTVEQSQASEQSYTESQIPEVEVPLPLAPLIPPAPIHYSVFPLPDYTFNQLQDPITKGFLTVESAQHVLGVFCTRATKFPFVTLPHNVSLDTLRRDHPFLLIAMLTFGTFDDAKLQDQLEAELRETLMKKIFNHGEKNLDLLQGLLVYLAWYHFFFKPERQQIYQLSQVAIAMSVDLGINRPYKPQDVLDPIPLCWLPSGDPQKIMSEELERRRTYLGCYYLVGSLSQGLRKPSNVHYNSYTEECCQVLTQVKERESDHLIQYFVRLQRFSDDVDAAFNYTGTMELPELDPGRVEVLSKSFQGQLKKIETGFPPEAWDSVSITMTFYRHRIYLHEVGFHAKPPQELAGAPVHRRSWYHATKRNDELISAMQAAKDYLDRFLALSSDDLRDFLLPDFVHLIYSILIMGSFASPLDAPTLDRERVRQIADLNTYLDALIDKMGGIVIVEAPKFTHHYNPYISHMNDLFEHYKSRFTRISETFVHIGTDMCEKPDFSFVEFLPTILKRCIEWEDTVMKGAEEVPPSTEGWDDIISDWPSSMDPSLISTNGLLG